MKRPSNKLKAEWSKKLKASGFNDIEQDEIYFKSGARSFASQTANEAYYAMASDFLREHSFVNHLERIIWEYHSNGISLRNIAKILTKVRHKKISRFPIHQVVQRLEIEMKKMYLLGFNE